MSINLNRLEIDESSILGRGSFGIVARGKYCGTSVAVKKIITKNPDLLKEITMLINLRHPNIVDMIAFSDNYIVMSMFDGNSSYKEDLTLLELYILGRDCMQAISYLNMHSDCILHADIKPENILVKRSRDNRIYKAVLGDVGLSKVCKGKGFSGTPGFMPLDNFPQTSLNDVYALGVSLLDSFFKDDVRTSFKFIKDDINIDIKNNVFEFLDKTPSPVNQVIGGMIVVRNSGILERSDSDEMMSLFLLKVTKDFQDLYEQESKNEEEWFKNLSV